MNAYTQAFYNDRRSMTAHAANVVLSLLLERIPRVSSAVDLGCGVGTWLSVLRARGVQDVRGLDGEWVDPSLLDIPPACFTQADLSQPLQLKGKYDLALSLEVDEHLPPERALSFVADLTQLSDFVLFSAAIPHQGGANHVNERWQHYWAGLFAECDFAAHDFIRPKIWDDARIPFWYKQNILFYSRRKRLAAVRSEPAARGGAVMPLSVVHPDQFLRMAANLTRAVSAAPAVPVPAQPAAPEIQPESEPESAQDYLSLCMICKDENDYLPEWLDYHILLGVDRFYIYDNESQVSLRDSLQEYVAKGWVVVDDIAGKARQLSVYDHCLQAYGPRTHWLGFIDVDEFLVPKTTLNLKELLKDYEAYGGLAVSSVFFGSNGHAERPKTGQLASYTQRTPQLFSDNTLIKSIVQPARVIMPYSPHDFFYQEGSWCVNEAGRRVDVQRFPHASQKIQLNHYFCRSLEEIEIKMRRGRPSQHGVWPRQRYDIVNELSKHTDVSALQILALIFKREQAGDGSIPPAESLVPTLAALARRRSPRQIPFPPPPAVVDHAEIYAAMRDCSARVRDAEIVNDHAEVKRQTLRLLELVPASAAILSDLAISCINLNELDFAWEALSKAWKMAPNSFSVLRGMVFYFYRVNNLEMTEKTCRLLLEISPQDLTSQGFLANALHDLQRQDEALGTGLAALEMNETRGEMPEQMLSTVTQKMAAILARRGDHARAARLWEALVKRQPENAAARVEWGKAEHLARAAQPGAGGKKKHRK